MNPKLSIIFFILFSACAYAGDRSYSEELGFPETPNLDANLSASNARIESINESDNNAFPDVHNGEALKDENGNIIVLDNVIDPKCVFYGVYIDGHNDVEIESNINIESLDLSCY